MTNEYQNVSSTIDDMCLSLLKETQSTDFPLLDSYDEIEVFQLRIGLKYLYQNTLVYCCHNIDNSITLYNRSSPHADKFYSEACTKYRNSSGEQFKCNELLYRVSRFIFKVDESTLKDIKINSYYYPNQKEKEFFVFRCIYTDLYKVAFPLYVQGRVIAILFIGQFKISSSERKTTSWVNSVRNKKSVESFLSNKKIFETEFDLVTHIQASVLDEISTISEYLESQFRKKKRMRLHTALNDGLRVFKEDVFELLTSGNVVKKYDYHTEVKSQFIKIVKKCFSSFFEEAGLASVALFIEGEKGQYLYKTTHAHSLNVEKYFVDFRRVAYEKTVTAGESIRYFGLSDNSQHLWEQFFQKEDAYSEKLHIPSDCTVISNRILHVPPVLIIVQVVKQHFSLPIKEVFEELEICIKNINYELAHLTTVLARYDSDTILRVYKHEIVHQILGISDKAGFLKDGMLDKLPEMKKKHISDDINLCLDVLSFMTENIDVITGNVGLAGRRLTQKEFDVDDKIFNRVMGLFVKQKKLKELWFTKHNQLPERTIVGPLDALDIIYFNLMSNAIKYSHTGSNIELAIENTSAFSRPFRLSITDYGVGISEDIKDQIFKLFYRGDISSSSVDGSGIGLGVAKRVSEMIGAQLEWSCKKISDYNIPLLVRFMQLPSSERERIWSRQEIISDEYERLERSHIISKAVSQDYVKSKKKVYDDEFRLELEDATYAVTFTLEF